MSKKNSESEEEAYCIGVLIPRKWASENGCVPIPKKGNGKGGRSSFQVELVQLLYFSSHYLQ